MVDDSTVAGVVHGLRALLGAIDAEELVCPPREVLCTWPTPTPVHHGVRRVWSVVDPSLPVVDIDDSDSWPSELAGRCHQLAKRILSTTDDPSELACLDLPVGEFEDEVRSLLDGHLLRAYHATRLLPYEAEDVMSGGLRVLSEGLVRDRLTKARERGHITDSEFAQLTAGTSLTDERVGRVFLFLPRSGPITEPGSFDLLLSCWGGEGIYWPYVHGATSLNTNLRSLGVPTIVVAQFDLFVDRSPTLRPSLPKMFVGAVLGLSDVCNVSCYEPVPGADIERLIQAGDPDYPQHPGLPQN